MGQQSNAVLRDGALLVVEHIAVGGDDDEWVYVPKLSFTFDCVVQAARHQV